MSIINLRQRAGIRQSGTFRLRLAITAAIVLSTIVAGVSTSPAITQAQESLVLVPVVGGLDAPVQVTNAGDGSDRLFVVERPGRIRVVIDGVLQETPFLDLTDRVHTDDSEQGLLALAFHPDYETNGEFFVLYTANDWANTVERFHVSVDPNRGNINSGQIVLALPDREPNHNGGTLVFGPDNMLYISTGDEGSGGDPYGNAQNPMSLFGKILRIDIDAGSPYAVPPDNPFVGTADAHPEVWAYGLRNPWRVSFDRQTGDLWVGDVGQGTWEEINYVPAGTGAGRNFGWNAMEGMHCFDGDCDPSLYTLPVAEYDHDSGCSVTAGHVYRGSAYPSLAGTYLFGDYCSGLLWSLTPDGDGWSQALELDTESWITSFGEDEAGELYLVDLAGVVYQVTAGGSQSPVITIPAFQRTWTRTDKPVADQAVDRTWMWGPGPITPELTETYAESPGGSRTVQFFDKSRMEDNAHRSSDPWDVTNGLLVVEMVEGYYQTGDTQRDDAPAPAEISIAGDLGQHPTYAYIQRQQLTTTPARDEGSLIDQYADADDIRDLGEDELPELIYATERVTIYGIDHTIASVFWEFMTSTGPIEDDGQLVTGLLFQHPVYATGFPITEAYWTTVRVSGVEQDILFQCFERRCLTYTPGNADGWKVEAGNVGLHYYTWRYGNQP